ncbi:TPA: hypothetical protein ACIU15_000098 [Yersinia enterocolitica]|uniref:hypothetical protein n=1 Tax=Yersinia enterocolitica TaxID=630 RepID=UPI000BF0FEC8|nr:hypothetical protein [Yersinia enterocolitica]EKN4025223.1 hypothetical protein [Yersinia enterocolitica]EKN4745559.1 hypothetical protein [Yersinia enterocolitica]EKN4769988.1 hypothetical protein [Yersinia enterocolitica]EKN5956346.1 hypothetical protein [Yersinia enterocolitica]EKN6212589.1 hypothetical protein [Yersinia enterocolitica]
MKRNYHMKSFVYALIALSFSTNSFSSEKSKISPSIKDCQGYGDSLVEKSGASLAEIGESPVDIRRTVDYYCMMGYRAAAEAKSPNEIDLWEIATLRELSGSNFDRYKYKASVIKAVSKMAHSFYENKKVNEQR